MTIETRFAAELSKFKRSKELYFASVLDLRDKLNKTQSELQALQKSDEETDIGSLEIEEVCDDEGKIDFIAEEVWLDSIRSKTGLDCRIIKGYCKDTIPMLGLYELHLIGVENGVTKNWRCKLWVVPAR